MDANQIEEIQKQIESHDWRQKDWSINLVRYENHTNKVTDKCQTIYKYISKFLDNADQTY